MSVATSFLGQMRGKVTCAPRACHRWVCMSQRVVPLKYCVMCARGDSSLARLSTDCCKHRGYSMATAAKRCQNNTVGHSIAAGTGKLLRRSTGACNLDAEIKQVSFQEGSLSN
eukprot:4362127-Amphidinium_carterae.1